MSLENCGSSAIISPEFCSPGPNSSVRHERVETLRKEVFEAFLPSSSSGKWLVDSTKRNLKAFGLTNVDPWEVITEAYIRAVASIEKGKLIWNTVSWLKTASLFITQEYLRERREVVCFGDMAVFDDAMRFKTSDPFEQNLDWQKMLCILNLLPCNDRDILLMRYKQHCSWSEIQSFFAKLEEEPPSIVALRQRKCRALKKLRVLIAEALPELHQEILIHQSLNSGQQMEK